MQRLTVLLLAVAFAAGCSEGRDVQELRTELKELRDSLGDTQYEGLDPQLSVEVREFQFRSKPIAYTMTEKEIRYSVAVRQTNQRFPLTRYRVSLSFDLIAADGSKVDDVAVYADVENGVATITETNRLFGDYAAPPIRMVPAEYNWSPNMKLKPVPAPPAAKPAES